MTMSSFEIALIVLSVIFAGAMGGMLISRRLPEHHLAPETRSVVTAAMAVVGTMSALVIGLLISSSNTSFTTRNGNIARLSIAIVELDTLLRRYGPEGDAARDALHRYTEAKYDDLFRRTADRAPLMHSPATAAHLDRVQDLILALHPADDRQRWLGAQALDLTVEVSKARALLVRENVSSLPLPFIGAVVLWLTFLFASFGLFAPRNVTAVVALFLCAFVISGALKLVLDMDSPFEGDIHLTRPPIRIQPDPLQHAIELIGRKP